MAYSSIFGPLVGRDLVAQQVITLLQTPPAGTAYPLLQYFLAEVERQRGLRARSIQLPGGYRVGLDFETFTADTLPLLIVVPQPLGDAERFGDGYSQWYEIQVAAVCADGNGDERVAQQTADLYGSAVAGVLAKNGGLGNPAGFTVDKTVLVAAPKTEFVDGADRKYARSVTIVHSLVETVATEQGPTVFGADPYQAPAAWPTVTLLDVQLSALNPAGVKNTPTGVTVTNQDVQVNE